MSVLQILTKDEIKNFESAPKFDLLAKNHFFKMTDALNHMTMEMKNDSNKILFILMYGYFKATNKFFDIQRDDENYLYIATRNNFDSFDFRVVTPRTIQRYKQLIKSNLFINEYTLDIESQLKHHAIELANNFTNRKKIFFSLVDYSKKINIEVPSYFALSKLIEFALNYQTKSILLHLKTFQKDKRLMLLDDFTNKDENYTNKYNINSFKKLGHSTKKKEMNNSVVQLNTIKSKFDMLKPIIDEVGITDKIAQYHSKWIEQIKMFQLTRKQQLEQQFLLLSFVKYQYFIRNDNLIDRFIAIMQSTKSSLLRHQKDLHFENEPKQRALVQSLEDSNLSILNDVSSIVNNEKLSDRDKIIALRALVETKTQNLKTLLVEKSLIETSNLDRFDFLEKGSQSLQGKLSGVVKLVEFDEKSSNKNLLTAIKYFKESSNIKQDAPLSFLDDEEQQVIFDSEGKIRVSLYKAFLFVHLSDGIRSGILNLKYSYKYKSFEDYLISKDEFISNKKELLKYHELEHLEDFDTFIKPIIQKLEMSFANTNERIEKELNIYFKPTPDSFILTTPKLEKTDHQLEHTIGKYFPQAEFISVIDLLHSVQIKADFLDSFKHYSLQNTPIKKLEPNLLYASIVGYGCNITLSKMAKISKGISENQLDTTTTWYLSEENTMEANDKIVAFIDSLDIAKLLQHDPKYNHTSSDGQKYNMKSSIDSTNAGWSHKYFGLDQGVIVNTFIDEKHRLYYSVVINVSERESGYVIDGLMHNDVVKSDIHSTDTLPFIFSNMDNYKSHIY